MAKSLKTDRLVLRPLATVDAAWMVSFWREKEVYRNTGSIPANVDDEFVEKRIKSAHDGEEAQIAMIRIIELNDERAGIVSLNRSTTTEAYSLGYAIHPKLKGQGIATEASGTLLNWADSFVTPRYYISGHFADNPASGAVLRKLGFLPCWRGPVFSAGREEKADHIYMSRLAS